MKKNNALTELREEKNRLMMKEKALVTAIKIDFIEIKEALQPANLVIEEASKLLKPKNEGGVLSFVTETLAQFLINNVVLKNSGIVTKIIGGYLVKNAAGNLLESKKSAIFNWISSFLQKNKNGSSVH
jgi:hypothetical protein